MRGEPSTFLTVFADYDGYAKEITYKNDNSIFKAMTILASAMIKLAKEYHRTPHDLLSHVRAVMEEEDFAEDGLGKVPFIAISNSDPIPKNLPEGLKKIIRQEREKMKAEQKETAAAGSSATTVSEIKS